MDSGRVASVVDDLGLAYLLGHVRLRGANDRLRHGRAVHHLVDRDQELLLTRRRAAERLERRLRDVERLGLPRLRGALRRLEGAVAEQARAPLVRGRAGHVRHTLEPDVALRAVDLEAEAAARRR